MPGISRLSQGSEEHLFSPEDVKLTKAEVNLQRISMLARKNARSNRPRLKNKCSLRSFPAGQQGWQARPRQGNWKGSGFWKGKGKPTRSFGRGPARTAYGRGRGLAQGHVGQQTKPGRQLLGHGGQRHFHSAGAIYGQWTGQMPWGRSAAGSSSTIQPGTVLSSVVAKNTPQNQW